MRRGEGLPADVRIDAMKGLAATRCATAFRILLPVLALILSGPVLAAGFKCEPPGRSDSPQPAKNELSELDEVIVDGSRSTRRTKELAAWLRLLEGQYSYGGYVDLCGTGNVAERQQVTGKSDCVSLYQETVEHLLSLYCVIDVRWPRVLGEDGAPVVGGESRLSPAVVIYGVVSDLPGIQFMQMDSKGTATHAQGRLVGDTLTAQEPCGMSATCRKVTRITAKEGEDIVVLIDVEVDARRVLRQAFLLHRLSNKQLPHRLNALTPTELETVGQR